MAECLRCHRWSPPDPNTGYDADDYCPDCLALIEGEDDEYEDDADDGYVDDYTDPKEQP